MPGGLEEPQPRARDPLGEDLGVGHGDDAVLASVDDERRRLDALQPPVAVVQRGRDDLCAVGLLGERMREPAPDVLGDALDARAGSAARS